MIGTILFVGGALGLGVVVLRGGKKKRKKKRFTPPPPKPPHYEMNPPLGGAVIERYLSPYAEGLAYRTKAGQRLARARLSENVDPDRKLTEVYAHDDADARSAAEQLVWRFGRPVDGDDVAVSVYAMPGFPNYRGSIWQSVSDGSFYLVGLYPSGGGTMGPFTGINEAQSKLEYELERARMGDL